MVTGRPALESVLHAAQMAATPSRLSIHVPSAPAGVWIVAIGKASALLVAAATPMVRESVRGGIVLTPGGALFRDALGFTSLKIHDVDHPWPTERNVAAARATHELITSLPQEALLLLLISGGGSAHLTLPAPGVELADLVAATRALMRAGATIHEINSVRSHCELLKGGGVAMACSASRILALAVSDVEGDPPGVIASGPVSPDPSTYADALHALTSRGLEHAGPTVTHRLRRGVDRLVPETPKSDADIRRWRDGNRLVTDSIAYHVVWNNARALREAASHAESLEYTVQTQPAWVRAESAAAGRLFARTLLGGTGPLCLLAGGEPTVNVGSATGLGGPSTEFALAAAIELDGVEGAHLAAYSTDGVDGPPSPAGDRPCAGAIADGTTCARARALGLDPEGFLAHHDSRTFFARLGDAIQTGPTGTNVNHVFIGLRDR